MGDRANIAIITQRNNKNAKPEQVWLYSHWGGHDLWKALQEGLKAAKPRWSDPSYCARIIICHAIPQKEIHEETGYGISTTIQDNEHPILVVDIPAQRVFTMDEGELIDSQVPAGYTPRWSCTFEEYLKLKTDPRNE